MNIFSKNSFSIISSLCVLATSSGSERIGIETNSPVNRILGETKPKREVVDPVGEACERQAVQFLVEEAASIARELQLPEPEPITATSLARIAVLAPRWWAPPERMVGHVISESFAYYVSIDCKLCFVESLKQDQLCMEWSKTYECKIEKMDTDAAYRLTERWLRAARMDVDALNAECTRRIEPNRYWNSGLKGGYFVPIYDVAWTKKAGRDTKTIARVSLLLPEKRLISLRVEESKYILRPSFVCTNLPVQSRTNK